MYLYKIIKSTDVRDSNLQILPLRLCNFVGEPQFGDGNGDNATQETDLEENIDLSAEILAQAEETLSEARAAADELIRQARLDGENIKQEACRQAELESEQIKLEARKTAFDQGYRDGYQEGMAKAKEDGETIREMALDVLKQSEESRRQTLRSLEGNIINLAREIAERLLSAQLSLEPEIVCNVAMESLRLVADRLQVVLYINPSELALYEKRKEEMRGLLPAKAELQVIADASIEPGGCRVETESGRVDATMETRRVALFKALYGEEG
ncbi:flagellar biosynthesis protein [Pelotomaculum isophthalicicum JI]|uniref:Flagellar biosynthesis protein n=1 Tax=Pelotomaculum isophthalicicum JI TaxID=947010 RepID=A0A9X4H3S1_9FIRM|nr:FliH/SctL family protein [Pelotomaculum isophthalicicum]MDF9409301.1 flagellar biosynthesis protein [Pelotomaculum isophthalicicum JI]